MTISSAPPMSGMSRRFRRFSAGSMSRATSTRAAMRAGTAPPAKASSPRCSSRMAAARTAAVPWKRPTRKPISSGPGKYQQWMIDYIEQHPDFIQPASRTQRDAQQFPAGPACRTCASAAPPSSGACRSILIPSIPCTCGWTRSPTTSPPWAMGARTTACTGSTGPPTST